jgi:hypothetical protein
MKTDPDTVPFRRSIPPTPFHSAVPFRCILKSMKTDPDTVPFPRTEPNRQVRRSLCRPLRFQGVVSGSHPPTSSRPPSPMRTPPCAPAGPQPLLQSCQESGGSTLRCRPLRTIAPSSAPSAALFREGRRRRDGATGTTGTGLLLVTTRAASCRRSRPGRGELPASGCAPLRTFTAGQESARLLTARTSARPNLPF